MHVLRVGEPYGQPRSWPETAQLRMTHAGCELALFFADPTEREVDAVRTGQAKFAWVASERIALLAYRFGDSIPWSDATYDPHNEDTSQGPAGPVDPEGLHLLITVVLVDANTGTVRAIRGTTWPAHFVRSVRKGVAAMLA